MPHWPHQAASPCAGPTGQDPHSHNPGRLCKAATRGRKCTPPATHAEHLEKPSAWLEGQRRKKLCRPGSLVWGVEYKPQECLLSPASKARLSVFSGMGFCPREEASLRQHESGMSETGWKRVSPVSSGCPPHKCCPPWTPHTQGKQEGLGLLMSGGSQ